MIYLAWAITTAATFVLGYMFRQLADRVKALEHQLKQKIDRPKPTEEPKSLLLDPLDPVQQAIWEREKMMERINPNE